MPGLHGQKQSRAYTRGEEDCGGSFTCKSSAAGKLSVTDVNPALGLPTAQTSSTGYGGAAGRAVSGNPNPSSFSNPLLPVTTSLMSTFKLQGSSFSGPVVDENPSEFSPASLIALSVVAGVAIILAKDYEIVSPEGGELRILRYKSGRHDSTSMIFGRQITIVEAEVKYKFRLRGGIGNRLELRKIHAAQSLLGRDASYKSIPEHQYETIPDTVRGPPPIPAARVPPAVRYTDRYTDIELQARATGTDIGRQGEGEGGRKRRHQMDRRTEKPVLHELSSRSQIEQAARSYGVLNSRATSPASVANTAPPTLPREDDKDVVVAIHDLKTVVIKNRPGAVAVAQGIPTPEVLPTAVLLAGCTIHLGQGGPGSLWDLHGPLSLTVKRAEATCSRTTAKATRMWSSYQGDSGHVVCPNPCLSQPVPAPTRACPNPCLSQPVPVPTRACPKPCLSQAVPVPSRACPKPCLSQAVPVPNRACPKPCLSQTEPVPNRACPQPCLSQTVPVPTRTCPKPCLSQTVPVANRACPKPCLSQTVPVPNRACPKPCLSQTVPVPNRACLKPCLSQPVPVPTRACPKPCLGTERYTA
ncbi:hypothetical protein Bbelb_026680 [Branchiostoma belcheri]|nr:hypothetical protein Bbelb_026680 [Branchiostoma belcheri]